MLLNIVPVTGPDFRWEVSLNMARNRGEVLSISDELASVTSRR